MAKKRIHRPEGSRPLESRQRQTPNARPKPHPEPEATPSARRLAFERASLPTLRIMQALPPLVVPIILGIMLFLGLTMEADWSGIILVIMCVFLSWLTALSWPSIGWRSRSVRVVVVLALLGLGVLKLADAF